MQQLTCTHCSNFFSRFVCSARSHGECDCPKCQGYCTCAAQDGKLPDRELMQQALEALMEATKIHASSCKCSVCRAVSKVQETLAEQPEQEPVAWMVLGDGKYGEYKPGMHVDTVGYKEYWERRGYELQPLYTSPPQRKPLPLKEVERLIYKNTKINPNVADDRELLGYIVNAVRAIEAAHGIKENNND